MKKKVVYIIFTILAIFAVITIIAVCSEKPEEHIKGEGVKVVNSPFGTIIYAGADTIAKPELPDGVKFDLQDIMECGEIIVLTVENKETFYELNKRAAGVEYLMAEKFAKHLGLFIRGELCQDTTEMIEKLHNGLGDIIITELPESMTKDSTLEIASAGANKQDKGIKYSWAVRSRSVKLKESLDKWFNPKFRQEAKAEEQNLISNNGIRHHSFAPYLDRGKGKISVYDSYFQRYAPVCGWDWRLLAAQCYAESQFDPDAQSFAGARGLMQIMPNTAQSIGLPLQDIFDPEKNIAAATRIIKKLNGQLRDIPSGMNRIKFILACYNGGINHIRDAQALARADNMRRYNNWESLKPYVMKLMDPNYYQNDSIVKSGYMRATETVNYVDKIMRRWNEYKRVAPIR